MITVFENEYAEIKCQKGVSLVRAKHSYIPMKEFKELFINVESLIEEWSLTKLIFDKRKLTVFHQPSMEWYFIEWKEKVYDLGLQTHRKILPKDPVFRECVKLGRIKIYNQNKDKKFNLMDIAYSNSIEEAIKN